MHYVTQDNFSFPYIPTLCLPYPLDEEERLSHLFVMCLIRQYQSRQTTLVHTVSYLLCLPYSFLLIIINFFLVQYFLPDGGGDVNVTPSFSIFFERFLGVFYSIFLTFSWILAGACCISIVDCVNLSHSSVCIIFFLVWTHWSLESGFFFLLEYTYVLKYKIG